MSHIIFLLMQSRLYKWLLKSVIPYIRFSMYYTSLRGDKYQAGYSLLKPGHIILTTDKKKLTSLLIPGDWSHAALCIGKFPDNYEIAEMTNTDYTKSHFFDLCKEADRVCILECVDFSHGYTQLMIEKCKSFEGVKYDSAFEFGVEALYCSELIYQSDFRNVLDVDISDLAGLGRPYLSPDGLYGAPNCKIVWDSDWH